MWESIEPTWGVFATFVLFFPRNAPFVLFAPLPLKIVPKGAIPPTPRTTVPQDSKMNFVSRFNATRKKHCMLSLQEF